MLRVGLYQDFSRFFPLRFDRDGPNTAEVACALARALSISLDFVRGMVKMLFLLQQSVAFLKAGCRGSGRSVHSIDSISEASLAPSFRRESQGILKCSVETQRYCVQLSEIGLMERSVDMNETERT